MSPGSETTIRRASVADLPRLLSLYSLLAVAPEPVVTLAEAEERFSSLAVDPRYELHVADREGQVVGTFSLSFLPGLSHGARDSCVVEDVVVSPEMQGMGIGRSMMRAAMERTALRDCYKLVLSSHLQRGRAHRFYESLGFARHGYSFLVAQGGGEQP